MGWVRENGNWFNNSNRMTADLSYTDNYIIRSSEEKPQSEEISKFPNRQIKLFRNTLDQLTQKCPIFPFSNAFKFQLLNIKFPHTHRSTEGP